MSPHKSRITVQDLTALPNLRNATTSTSTFVSALRTILHIDMDAFYAQCEMNRLGLASDKPLAVRQWQGLLAVNYPARKFGIKRHTSVAEAKVLCPDIILQHVPTWVVDPTATASVGAVTNTNNRDGSGATATEGIDAPAPAMREEAMWTYKTDSHQNMASHKVSLDPYRRESRKILNVLREELDQIGDSLRGVGVTGEMITPVSLFEKASVDEVFLDVSGLVHAQLMNRYPHLQEFVILNGPTDLLPPVGEDVLLNWGESDKLTVIHPDSHPEGNGGSEDDEFKSRNGVEYPFCPVDWDDVCIHIAHQICHQLRFAVLMKAGYTCSAGVASNKMLAKLGSGHLKPSGQTVIRPCAADAFLNPLKFTQMRSLGGKLGDRLVSIFGTDKIEGVAHFSLSQIRQRLESGGSVIKIDDGDDDDDGGDDAKENGGGNGRASSKFPGASSGGVSTLDHTALWLHNLFHGIDASTVRVRPGTKSILSAKSFNPPLPNIELTRAWIRVFVADLHTRCIDEGMVDEQAGWWSRCGRRPKTMTVHLRQGTGRGPYEQPRSSRNHTSTTTSGPMRSRSGPISYPSSTNGLGQSPAKAQLFDNACRLVAQVVAQGGVWPCSYLSLRLSGFETSGVSLVELFGNGASKKKNINGGISSGGISRLLPNGSINPDTEIGDINTTSLKTITPAQLMGYVPDDEGESQLPIGIPGMQRIGTVTGGSTVIRIPYRGGKKPGAGAAGGKGKGKDRNTIMNFFGAAAAPRTRSVDTGDDDDGGGGGRKVLDKVIRRRYDADDEWEAIPPELQEQFLVDGDSEVVDEERLERIICDGDDGDEWEAIPNELEDGFLAVSKSPYFASNPINSGQGPSSEAVNYQQTSIPIQNEEIPQLSTSSKEGERDEDEYNFETPKSAISRSTPPFINNDPSISESSIPIARFEEPESEGNPVLVTCPRCSRPFVDYLLVEHSDWHFAQDLANQFESEVSNRVGEQDTSVGNNSTGVDSGHSTPVATFSRHITPSRPLKQTLPARTRTLNRASKGQGSGQAKTKAKRFFFAPINAAGQTGNEGSSSGIGYSLVGVGRVTAPVVDAAPATTITAGSGSGHVGAEGGADRKRKQSVDAGTLSDHKQPKF